MSETHIHTSHVERVFTTCSVGQYFQFMLLVRYTAYIKITGVGYLIRSVEPLPVNHVIHRYVWQVGEVTQACIAVRRRKCAVQRIVSRKKIHAVRRSCLKISIDVGKSNI